MELGSFLKERRKRLGLSQQQIADSLMVSKQAVSKWEKGAGLPDVYIIPDLAKLLRVKPIYIMNIIWEGESDFETYRFTCPDGTDLSGTGIKARYLNHSGEYELRCSKRAYDKLLEEYGEDLRIKTTKPTRKLLEILRNRRPTCKNYSDEEIFDIILKDCCARLCGSIYDEKSESKGSGHMLTRLLNELISESYFRVITLGRINSMLCGATSQDHYDYSYKLLCDELMDIERRLLDRSVFSESITYNKGYLYLSPHIVIQAVITDMILCGLIDKEHPALPYIHYTLTPKMLSGQELKLDRFDDYLIYQKEADLDAVDANLTRIELSIYEEQKRREKEKKAKERK